MAAASTKAEMARLLAERYGYPLAPYVSNEPEQAWAFILDRIEAAMPPDAPAPALPPVPHGLEARVRELLTRIAPAGSTITPAFEADVRRQVLAFVAKELITTGLTDAAANTLAVALTAALKLKAQT